MYRFLECEDPRSAYKLKGDLRAPGLLPSKGDPKVFGECTMLLYGDLRAPG